MKQEDRLKIQAWLDGELAPQESGKMADLVDLDSEAKSAAEELKILKNLLKSGENEAKIEDSRDFYWSQVQRQIESEKLTAAREPSQTRELVTHSPEQTSLFQWLLPAGSLIAISALILNYEAVNYDQTNSPPDDNNFKNDPPKSGLTESLPSQLEDESSATPEVGVFSFEGIQKERTLNGPEDPNTLPESIENPDR
jgi:hypothetical protein